MALTKCECWKLVKDWTVDHYPYSPQRILNSCIGIVFGRLEDPSHNLVCARVALSNIRLIFIARKFRTTLLDGVGSGFDEFDVFRSEKRSLFLDPGTRSRMPTASESKVCSDLAREMFFKEEYMNAADREVEGLIQAFVSRWSEIVSNRASLQVTVTEELKQLGLKPLWSR